MRICLISVEIFAWGKYGGFGRATRTIGGALAELGHEVIAVVPRRGEQRAVEELDGMTVLGFSPWRPTSAAPLLREADADLYHSCEPSFATYLARRQLPGRAHIVTLRDPRDLHDWWLEFQLPSRSRAQVLHNFLYESNPLVRRAVRRMDRVYTIARYLIPKVRRMYRLSRDPEFLPTPVPIPRNIQKAATPTVCYVARLDRRKRPERFFDLAERFPEVRFIAMGKSRDPSWERRLHDRYGSLPNLDMLGFVDQFASDTHSEVLSKSWIMVNTATREALPNAFLEAAAHGCAILSGVDPDGFATRFGYHATRDDFVEGLSHLLENDRWRERGEAARREASSTFAFEHALERHLAAYRDALGA